MTSNITVIIPAHNEEAGLPLTLRSLREQTVSPAEVIVVADNCTDETARIAQEAGVKVIEGVGGSKARAQNLALPHVTTSLVLPLDADTMLSPDYLELLEPVFSDQRVTVAAGCVLTQSQDSIWSKARTLEYLQSFSYFRRVQQAAHSVVVCAGCCSVFRVKQLREAGGFPEGTLTEDIDYTLSQHRLGNRAEYVNDAVAYAAEPETMRFMRTQLKRWKSGHAQSVRKHLPGLVRRRPMVAFWLFLQAWEVAILPLIVVLPFLAIQHHVATRLVLWAVVGELVTFWGPVLVGCRARGFPVHRAFLAYPSWWALKALNLEADLRHWVPEVLCLRKPFSVYEKGH